MTTIRDSFGRDVIVEPVAGGWRYSNGGMAVILAARDDPKAIGMFDTYLP